MKIYTITLPKKENSAKVYKDAMIDRIITAYPWMTIDSGFDYPKSNYGIEYAGAGDLLTLGLSKTHNVSWLPKCTSSCPFAKNCNCNNCSTIGTNFDLETEFFNAMSALDAYAKSAYPFKKDYDFEDIFGTPVKIFDNFVQIGYDIIPIAIGSLNYLKPATKKTIIDITIKIKKGGFFN